MSPLSAVSPPNAGANIDAPDAPLGARPAKTPPALVGINMGYGHLRPAFALATYLEAEVLDADRPPLASAEQARAWALVRQVYEATSRASALPKWARPFKGLLDRATHIPKLYPRRDLSGPTPPVQFLERLGRKGLGQGLSDFLRTEDRALLTTFYAPALLADLHGHDRIFCVVTDSDINRVWAPFTPEHSHIHYFVPSVRALRRLRAYGVHKDRITHTGFPLPHELVGEDDGTLKRNLARRLVRLDRSGVFRRQFAPELDLHFDALDESLERERVHLAFAVGGAGAQSHLAHDFLPGLRHLIEKGHLRLSLIAGCRPEVAEAFESAIRRAGMQHTLGQEIHIQIDTDIPDYLRSFNRIMASTDLLWTKPSELSFFAGLGIPLILAPPVGIQEHYNRRWVLDHGAGFLQRTPRDAGEWIWEGLSEGILAHMAFTGYKRLPHRGLYEIAQRLTAPANSSPHSGPVDRLTEKGT